MFFRYIPETIGLHELAPQYRQFYSIFESFKISEQKANIAPPVLAMPTALSSKTATDDMDENEDGEDVSNKETFICMQIIHNIFQEKNG